MQPTLEQIEILNTINNAKDGEVIQINAFAGTGKTTTLKLISEEMPNKKILYLAFNKSIQTEAASKFPKNVVVKTTHGLAYQAIKSKTDINLNKLRGEYKVAELSNIFDIDYETALEVKESLNRFLNGEKEQSDNIYVNELFEKFLSNEIDPTHSMYLKQYQLLLLEDTKANTQTINKINYDVILLDEAQDTNGVTLSIFENLHSNLKILVGDKHQQIYSFRGSVNAMDSIKAVHQCYLTTTFRFPENIAFYANFILNNFKAEKEKIKTIRNGVLEDNTVAFISRTNSQLIYEIADLIKDLNTDWKTVREPNEIFKAAESIYYFINNKKEYIAIEYKYLLKFRNLEELEKYANDVDDVELKTAIKINKDIGSKIFKLKEKAKENYYKNNNDVSLFLTTAHTSKGLEFDHVYLADDYKDFAELFSSAYYDNYKDFVSEYNKYGVRNPLMQKIVDELNIFYVALTRAKNTIKFECNLEYFSQDGLDLLNKKIYYLYKVKTAKDNKSTKNVQRNLERYR